MRYSICALMMLITSAPAYGARLRGAHAVSEIRNFLVDPSKPYVYLEVDHIGPREPHNEKEPNTGIYLRLRNNCRLPIIVSTFGGPTDGTDGEVGVMDEVVLNKTVVHSDLDGTGGDSKPVPMLLTRPDVLLSTELKEAKARLKSEEEEKAIAEVEQEKVRQEVAAKEQAERPSGYFSDVGSATTVPPGKAIYFSVPVNYVDKRWHFQISFRFALKRQGPIRQPYSYVAFWWDDLPEAYRTGSIEYAEPKSASSVSTLLHESGHIDPPKPQ